MNEQAWTHRDKSSWTDGPWQHEPDKVQWIDAGSDLDCLIVRGPSGALCGYVGVPEGHPLFGIGYSDETERLSEQAAARLETPVRDTMADMIAALSGCVKSSPEMVLDVHGGLTFSDECDEPTEAQWLGIEAALADESLQREARKYPTGDSARRVASLTEQRGLTFAEWREYQQARRICHIPVGGRPTRVWWFGFDCSHYRDVSPAFDAMSARHGIPRFSDDDSEYRTIHYVRRQVTSLAGQLAALSHMDGPREAVGA